VNPLNHGAILKVLDLRINVMIPGHHSGDCELVYGRITFLIIPEVFEQDVSRAIPYILVDSIGMVPCAIYGFGAQPALPDRIVSEMNVVFNHPVI
jgi:hypothetical protein